MLIFSFSDVTVLPGRCILISFDFIDLQFVAKAAAAAAAVICEIVSRNCRKDLKGTGDFSQHCGNVICFGGNYGSR